MSNTTRSKLIAYLFTNSLSPVELSKADSNFTDIICPSLKVLSQLPDQFPNQMKSQIWAVHYQNIPEHVY